MIKSKWTSSLFKPGEVIGFKNAAASPVIINPNTKTQFFIINPLKEAKGGNFLTNIAEHRNFLIEFDGGETPEEQWKYVEEIRLPYSMCTYSGGKSLHFIVALDEKLDEETYYLYSKVLVGIVKGADRLINPNRAARTPNAIRDNGNVQELIEAKAPINPDRLVNWLLFGPLAKKAARVMREISAEKDELLRQRVEQEARKASGEERLSIPRIYRDMQNQGLPHPEAKGRHESLVKFGVWLFENGYGYEEIEQELHEAAVGLGVDGRQDDKNVLRWLFNRRRV